jgi:hypothetical protein
MAVALFAIRALAWYAWVWVSSQRRCFDARNLRMLAALSLQITEKVDNFDGVIDNAVGSGKSGDDMHDYVHVLSRDLHYVTKWPDAVGACVFAFLRPSGNR